MEFWVLILTVWAFYRWVQSRIRRQKDDERFARVVEALNKLEPRLKDLHKLETRVHELENRLASSNGSRTKTGRASRSHKTSSRSRNSQATRTRCSTYASNSSCASNRAA